MSCGRENCQVEHGHGHHKAVRPWYREPLVIIGAVILITFISHSLLLLFGNTLLSPLFEAFWRYLKLTWWAILLGLILGGLIDVLVPPEFMSSLLARGKRSIIIAVFLGFLASACSHGILAIAVSLYKKGASTAATLAFLLASPWANLSITFLLLSLFGKKALLMIAGALVVALTSGFIFQFLEERGLIEGAKIKPKEGKVVWHIPPMKGLVDETIKSIWGLAKMVVWWVLLGFFLASVLGAYIPEHIFHQFFGPTILGMLATLLVASVIEVCSEGSSPLAFELYKQTGAFGNAFVFLQAGVVTDFTEVGIVLTNIGKRAALALVLVTVPLVLLLGFIFNTLIL
jgi:uncharacterized membrane protein YraQ (UPF0718 family)